tara:strand:+ start:1537 stop:1878 length:342 start_codon:yes stop_codon:yes gene_type:complete
MKNLDTAFELYEIEEETLTCSYSDEDGSYIELTCSLWTDKIENLWGDQVSSISLIGYFEKVEQVEAFDLNGKKVDFIKLDEVERVKKILQNEEFEIDETSCKVDYSPQYYDLV